MSQFTVGAMGLLAAFCAPNYESFNFVCSQDEQRDLTPQLLFLYYMFYIYDQELISRVSDVNNQHRKSFNWLGKKFNFCSLSLSGYHVNAS